MSTTPREHLTYTAHTAQQEGVIFEHYGTVEGAARKATAYAHSAFPREEISAHLHGLLDHSAELKAARNAMRPGVYPERMAAEAHYRAADEAWAKAVHLCMIGHLAEAMGTSCPSCAPNTNRTSDAP